MVHPPLSSWSYHKKCDTYQVNKVLRYFPRRALKYSYQCYEEIISLNLRSLKLGRKIFDLSLDYKILNDSVYTWIKLTLSQKIIRIYYVKLQFTTPDAILSN